MKSQRHSNPGKDFYHAHGIGTIAPSVYSTGGPGSATGQQTPAARLLMSFWLAWLSAAFPFQIPFPSAVPFPALLSAASAGA